MSGQQQQIEQPGDPRKWRTELPNLIDDADLDPYEFRLLVHYYRVGDCWESTKTTAEKCKMSVGAVAQKRRSIAEKGWIEITEPDPNKQNDTIKIVVVDRWIENYQTFAQRSPHERQGSSGEPKNNHIKNTSSLREEDTVSKSQPTPLFPVSEQEQTPPPQAEESAAWKELLAAWDQGFNARVKTKAVPRQSSSKSYKNLRAMFKDRWQDPDFRDHWREAIEHATRSLYLRESGWFNLEFFLRSGKKGDSWQRCLVDEWAWKDKALAQQGGITRPVTGDISIQNRGPIKNLG